MSEHDSIIDVDSLSVVIRRNKILNDLSFTILARQCLGIVGESGSGKTTLARALLGLVPVSTGTVKFQTGIDKQHDIQFIFQDPLAALNPRMTVEQLITEPLDYLDRKIPGEERLQMLKIIMEQVGLEFSLRQRYAHEFSGGQCQRIGIARAIITRPKILICDEPVSALDVSVRAQIINLLKSLQQELDLTLVFIAHDLSLVRFISDELLVLYQGKLMESGFTDEIFEQPQHPYTYDLIRAEPLPDPQLEKQRFTKLAAENSRHPDGLETVSTSGCVYASRCKYSQARCFEQDPPTLTPSQARKVACFFPLDTLATV